MDLVNDLVELYRKASTELPEEIVAMLKDSEQSDVMKDMIRNQELARKKGAPICQDTGTPIFYVQYGPDFRQKQIAEAIKKATLIATEKVLLRPNSVDVMTDKNPGDNSGDNFPVMHFEEIETGLIIDLLLKGGGSENVGTTYKLPDEKLNAGRDFAGVRKVVLDAVVKAQGRGCPPYILGVGIGGSKDITSYLAKKQLVRRFNDSHPNSEIAQLENDIRDDANKLGIGPLGFGGADTVKAVKIGTSHRHPASYFVDISFSCWVCRKGRLTYD